MSSPITKFALFALAACCGAQAAIPQTVDVYEYDARGRLVKVQRGEGTKAVYTNDLADNRTAVVAQRQLDTNAYQQTWEAEALPHLTGFAEGSGWAATTSDAVTAMTYGPYVYGVSAGSHTAVWKIMIDNNTNASTDAVVTLDVNVAETGQVLASKTMTWRSFAAAGAYQIFEVPFTSTSTMASQHLEFRVWHFAKAHLNVDKVAYY